MAEKAAIAGSSLSENVSESDSQAPLSPIVQYKKFRRKRKLRPTLDSVLTIPKPENLQLKRAIMNLESSSENAPSVDQSDLSRTTNLDTVLRLKNLEASKVQKTNVVEAISFHRAQPTLLVDKKPLEIKPTTKSGGLQTATIADMKLLDAISRSTSSRSGRDNNSTNNFDGFNRASVASSKLAKNVFKSEHFNDLKLQDNVGYKQASFGFASASNYHSLLQKCGKEPVRQRNMDGAGTAKKMPYDIFTGENFDDLMLGESVGFKKVSFNSTSTYNLASESGILPKKSPNNIFKGEAFDDLKLDVSRGFKKASDVLKNTPSKILDDVKLGFKKAQINQDSFISHNKTSFKNIFEGENFDNLKVCGFQSASPKQFTTASNAKNVFQGESFDDLDSKFDGFQPAATKLPCKSEKTAARNIFEGENFNDLAGLKATITLPSKAIKKFQSPFKTPLKSPSKNVNDSNKNPDHNTPENNLLKKSSQKRLGCSYRGSHTPSISVPEKNLKRGRLMFEEIEEELGAKRIRTSTPLKRLAEPLSCDITPIQKSSFSDTLTSDNNRLSFNKSTEGDVQDWLENLSKEKRFLEEKLRIINEKQAILTMHDSKTTKIRPGVLYKSKSAKQNRLSLKNYIGNCIVDGKIDNFLNEINPQNAHLVHFNMCDTSQSHVKTSDGALTVPNATNEIGLTEIAHSFRLIDGVDPALIPQGWIDNHFRWIVWKLASYERWTKDKFLECLSVENVMQQLKYRYDLEIDCAKRSILRRIFEKDDCPQRRMVLCVSNIMQKNHSYELELSDGWYSIRTVIDQPLCKQITKRKIRIGLKLMIYGAEIVNCEQGCHPLEATDFIYLKINFNCTRRASWWCKLGAQRHSGPFSVPLSSTCPSGGKIGLLKCFILRVYPVQYMEKFGNTNVWRNRKAEERKDQEFYSKSNYANLRNVQDPRLLYDLVQNCNDPEELQELLTSSQKTSLNDYTITNKSFSNKHAVTALLKIKLLDVAENSTEIRDFFIWRPSESHLDELKEGDVVTVFNVNCSPKWGLGAGKLTEFKREAKAKDERFAKFKRKATKIEELNGVFRQKFREFDCVGFVVRKQIETSCQKVWLADTNKRLLLINIEDSPHNILVLDAVDEGQIISVCNLLMKQCFERHFLAVGGLSVIFARYSAHKHLQKALDEMEKDFGSLNRELFRQECQQKIIKIEGKNPHYMDGMECSQMTITDMALLECMDKLTA